MSYTFHKIPIHLNQFLIIKDLSCYILLCINIFSVTNLSSCESLQTITNEVIMLEWITPKVLQLPLYSVSIQIP